MKKIFISYVKENIEIVDRLYQELDSHGIQVWLDRNDIAPGSRWKREIRRAIQQGAFFIACFSDEYNERHKTYMNEELTIAIEELRQRPVDQEWFIPVKLNECEVPDLDIGRGETLGDLQYVNLYEDWDGNLQRILEIVQRAPSVTATNTNTSEERINTIAPEAWQGMWSLESIGGLSTKHLMEQQFRSSGLNDKFIDWEWTFSVDGRFISQISQDTGQGIMKTTINGIYNVDGNRYTYHATQADAFFGSTKLPVTIGNEYQTGTWLIKEDTLILNPDNFSKSKVFKRIS